MEDRRAQFKREAAKELRANATEMERKRWALLRRKQLSGVRFRRQQPIGPYIADFFCSAAKLVVELDGDQHGLDRQRARDAARTAWLEARGYRVLRFSNGDVFGKPDVVLEGIWHAVQESGVPLPEPPSAVRPSLKGRVS